MIFEQDRAMLFELFNSVGTPSSGPLLKEWYQKLAKTTIFDHAHFEKIAYFNEPQDISPSLTLFATANFLGLHLHMQHESIVTTTTKSQENLEQLLELIPEVTDCCLTIVDAAIQTQGLKASLEGIGLTDEDIMNNPSLEVDFNSQDDFSRVKSLFPENWYDLVHWWLENHPAARKALEKDWAKLIKNKQQEILAKRKAEEDAAARLKEAKKLTAKGLEYLDIKDKTLTLEEKIDFCDEIEALFQKALELEPELHSAQAGLENLKELREDLNQFLQDRLAIEQMDQANKLVQDGWDHFAVCRYADAERLFKEALELVPNFEPAKNGLKQLPEAQTGQPKDNKEVSD